MGAQGRGHAGRVSVLCVLLQIVAATTPGYCHSAAGNKHFAVPGSGHGELDVVQAITKLRADCTQPTSPTSQLSAQQLLAQHSSSDRVQQEGAGALERACSAILACQLDEGCELVGESAAAGALDAAADAAHTPANDVGWASKASAAGALFVESLMGIAIPLVLQSLSGNAQWWLSLLNCFSGGVFLAAGLVHLLPHCQEAQEALGSAAASYPPLYLVLITLGYFLVLFAERVLFDVHGSSHSHACCSHTGISHSHEEDSSHHGNGHTHSHAHSLGAAPHQHSSACDSHDHAHHAHGSYMAPVGCDDAPGLQQPLLVGSAPEPAGNLAAAGMLLVALGVHTFLECMALGLMNGAREFWVLFSAIAAHKLISALALSSRFLKEGATHKQICLYVGPFALVAPVAVLAGSLVVSSAAAAPAAAWTHLVFSCFATGTFLYVGASEVVEEEFEGDMRSGRTDISQLTARYIKFGACILGVAAIAATGLIPDEDHGHGLHMHHHHH